MNITDGTGSGSRAKVDSRNRLFTDSVSQSVEHFANTSLGTSFSIVLQQTPTGAGDYFFYFKNNGTTSVVLEGFEYRVASAESVEVVLNNEVGTIGGNTTATPVNLNTGSGKSITGDIYVGNNITGLTNGSTAYRVYMTSTETKTYNFDQDIIVPQGGVVAFKATSGSVQIDMNINLYIGDF